MPNSNIEDWVTIQMTPARRVLISPRTNPLDVDGLPRGQYAPFWLLQELRSVNGNALPAPFPTRIVPGHIVDSQIEPINLTTHRAMEF